MRILKVTTPITKFKEENIFEDISEIFFVKYHLIKKLQKNQKTKKTVTSLLKDNI